MFVGEIEFRDTFRWEGRVNESNRFTNARTALLSASYETNTDALKACCKLLTLDDIYTAILRYLRDEIKELGVG